MQTANEQSSDWRDLLVNVEELDGTDPGLAVLFWSFTGTTALFVLVRLAVRIQRQRNLLADDFFCFVGFVLVTLSSAFFQISIDRVKGKQYPIIRLGSIADARLWEALAFSTGILSIGPPKIAVAVLLIRLLEPGIWQRWLIRWSVVWSLLSQIVVVLLLLFQCRPFENRGTGILDPERGCDRSKVMVGFSVYAGAFSALVDIYLAVYPATVLVKLQMKLRKKIGLSIALGVGLSSAAVAITRVVMSVRLSVVNQSLGEKISGVIKWTNIESCTIVIACSIPVMAPLMEMAFRWYNSVLSTYCSSNEVMELQRSSGNQHPSTVGGQRHLPPPPQIPIRSGGIGPGAGLSIASSLRSSRESITSAGGQSAFVERGEGQRSRDSLFGTHPSLGFTSKGHSPS